MRRFCLTLSLVLLLLALPKTVRASDLEVVQAALQAVQDDFLEKVGLGDYSVWALVSLGDYDPKLRVVDDESRVSIYYDSKLYRSFSKPSGQKAFQPKQWAKYILKVKQAVEDVSPRVKQKDFELVDAMLKKATAQLDEHSAFLSAKFPDKDENVRLTRDFDVRMLDSSVLYMSVRSITKFTPNNIKAALQAYQKQLQALLIDLRGCSGGSLKAAIDVANIFLDEGIITSTMGRDYDSVMVYKARGEQFIKGAPIVVLVDENTASSAEILAAALKEQGLAVLMGTNTFGKGTVQNVINLPEDNKMLLTNAYAYTPAGDKIDGKGIKPDICLYRAKDNFKLDDVQGFRFDVCPAEDRYGRRIDIDLAKEFLNQRLRLN